jgi:Fe-S-cluster containining protein
MRVETMESKDLLHTLSGGTFTFSCHKGIECFTRCCAALQLVLTPYDIVRLKNRLGISSEEFLERHSLTRFDRHPRFPMVLLKMTSDEFRTCPFVSLEGCTVYDDRPGACRIYPLARAAQKGDSENETREKFFVVKEEHCLGFGEERTWTVESWMSDQRLGEYNRMNDRWLEIISSSISLGPAEGIPRKLQMFFMASYNLDRFRAFLFGSRFFHLFRISDETRLCLEKDDEALMNFGFNWLKFSLFGLPTMQPKSGSESANSSIRSSGWVG